MIDLLHSLNDDEIVYLNGVMEQIDYAQRDDSDLKLNILFSSGKEIISTPRRVELYVPDRDTDSFSQREIRSLIRAEN